MPGFDAVLQQYRQLVHIQGLRASCIELCIFTHIHSVVIRTIYLPYLSGLGTREARAK